MKILRIALHGFKRFNLSSKGDIDITFDSKLILILGPNGAGKSSFLKELSPLPASAIDFNKNGYKYIEIEYHNSLYKLTNTFDGGTGRFSFIKDDEELNPGYTVTVYKDLVYKYFKLDTATFNLFNNESSFIYYSNQERKNWITKISNNDLTYAISFYNKNKELLRDIQGSIKLNKTKLLQESDKLINDNQYNELKLLITDSHQLIDKLLDIRDNKVIDPIQLKTTISDIEHKISTYTDKLITSVTNYPKISSYATQEALDEEFIVAQAAIAAHQNKLLSIEAQLKSTITNIETLKKANIDNRETSLLKLNQITLDISELNSKLKYPLNFNNPSEALTTFLNIIDNLQDIFINLIDNPDKLYNKEYYTMHVEQYNKLTNKINQLEALYKTRLTTKQELETRKKESSVECPKCNYSWYLNYDEESYNKLVLEIDAIYKDLEASKVKAKELEEHLTIIKAYLTYLSNYRSIVYNWSILKPIWDIIDASNDIYERPKHLLVILDDIKADLITSIELKTLSESKKELETVLALLEKDSQLSLDNLTNAHEALEKEYHQLSSEINRLKKQVEYIKTLKSSLYNIDATRKALEGFIEAYTENMNLAISFKRKHAIDEIIRSIKLFISDKEDILSKQTIQHSIVDNINKTIIEQEELLTYYKVIEKTLSPTEGLIAKSLTGFINTFILHINNFIQKVWSYPLELITITPDDNLDINYKFKVSINDSIVIPDIAKLSSAQKEILDLAIRIVSMKCLNMIDYPLYLDEFAAKMDIMHRKAAFYTISNLLLNSNFSQIFLINHYEDQYGSLKNAQVVNLAIL
jgi:DNA repair exonuclease SbcCD ATPase subunit